MGKTEVSLARAVVNEEGGQRGTAFDGHEHRREVEGQRLEGVHRHAANPDFGGQLCAPQR